MKTRKQKVICILACVFLLASFFVVPVSAAEDYSTVVFKYPLDGSEFNENYFGFVRKEDTLNTQVWDKFRRPSSSVYGLYNPSSGDSFWLKTYYFTWPDDYGNQGYTSFFLGASSFGVTSYSTADTIWIDQFRFAVMLGQAYSSFSQYRFCFRDITDGNTIGSVVGYSAWENFSFSTTSADAIRYITSPQKSMEIINAGDYDGLAFFIEFNCSSMNSAFAIGIQDTGIAVNYGRGSNPNYPVFNAPTPDDENQIGGYIYQESQLMQNNSDNLTSGRMQFSQSMNIIGGLFSNGLVTAANVISRFLNIGTLYALTNVSLGLGLFASLLGLAASIVGAADRRAAAASRRERSKK